MEKPCLKKKKKRKNQGFSLVEVLLAICILGLIAAPVLQMFYSSYAMNQKSRKYLAAADLAQTMIEAISSQTYEDSKTSKDVEIKGLEDYYITNNHAALYTLPNGMTDPNLNKGWESKSTDTDKKVLISHLTSYSGYSFKIKLVFDLTGLDTSAEYYSVPVFVTIKDEDGNDIITVNTQVPNKR